MEQTATQDRIAASFARQNLMTTLGATLGEVREGCVAIELPFNPSLAQQDGFLHAGAVTSIADSACGYAALTTMPEGSAVLSVEFKINLLAPAIGERFVAIGQVARAGRTLVVCTAEVFALAAGARKTIAMMQGTMMRVAPGQPVTALPSSAAG